VKVNKKTKAFATIAQRQAWQAECERKATKRTLARLIRQLSRQLREPVPPEQSRLAQEYREARAAHVQAQRECVALGLNYDAVSQGIEDFFNDEQVPA
jgi:hypothetical protein